MAANELTSNLLQLKSVNSASYRRKYVKRLKQSLDVSHDRFRSCIDEESQFYFLDFGPVLRQNANNNQLKSGFTGLRNDVKDLLKLSKQVIGPKSDLQLSADSINRFVTAIKGGRDILDALQFDESGNIQTIDDLYEVLIDLNFSLDKIDSFTKAPAKKKNETVRKLNTVPAFKSNAPKALPNQRSQPLGNRPLSSTTSATKPVVTPTSVACWVCMEEATLVCDTCAERFLCEDCVTGIHAKSPDHKTQPLAADKCPGVGAGQTSAPSASPAPSSGQTLQEDSPVDTEPELERFTSSSSSDSGDDLQTEIVSPAAPPAVTQQQPPPPQPSTCWDSTNRTQSPKHKNSDHTNASWFCDRCTMENVLQSQVCSACGFPRIVSLPTGDNGDCEQGRGCEANVVQSTTRLPSVVDKSSTISSSSKLIAFWSKQGEDYVKKCALCCSSNYTGDWVDVLVGLSLDQNITATNFWLTDSRVRDVQQMYTDRLRGRDGTNWQPTLEETKRALAVVRGRCNVGLDRCWENHRKELDSYKLVWPWLRENVVQQVLSSCSTDQSRREQLVRAAQQTLPKEMQISYLRGSAGGSGSRAAKRNEYIKWIKERLNKGGNNRKTDEAKLTRCVSVELGLGTQFANLLLRLIQDEEISSNIVLEPTSAREKQDQGVTLDDLYRTVVESDGDFDFCKRRCGQVCIICSVMVPKDKMENVSYSCKCEICSVCFLQWMDVTINNDSASTWTCPVCSKPEPDEKEGRLSLFVYLSQIITARGGQYHKFKEVMDKKITDWNLIQEANFMWCANQCQNGFLVEEGLQNIKLQCHTCRKFTCRDCKRAWEPDHDNRTCEEFEAVKIQNDPQIKNLLSVIGIECPNCRMRYELARGGCMHFHCSQCRFEFCSGCYKKFVHKECDVPQCKGKGMHAHHPRNCFFYLRDESVDHLHAMLQAGNVDYQLATAQGLAQCSVRETEEVTEIGPDQQSKKKLVDKMCGKPVVFKSDLCEIHYKEYLISKINRAGIDPADFMTSLQMRQVLVRQFLAPPEPNSGETDEAYKARLLPLVRAIELPKLK